MINKNSIKIITLNERGEKIVIFGIFYLSDINKLISIAEEHNMPCLGFISQCEDTYFNEEQCKIIKEELNKIKDDSNYLMILNPIIDLKENTLIKTIDNPKVYVIQNDERHWIKTEETFNNLNYHWNEVVTVGDVVLDKYLVGDDIE